MNKISRPKIGHLIIDGWFDFWKSLVASGILGRLNVKCFWNPLNF